MNCKLISFDVSVCSTGYAVYEDGILVNYGNFVHKEPKKDHLALMTNDIFCLLETENPQIIVVEDVPYMNNINTFKKLERLIARIEAWAYVRDNITYAEYKPTQWRKLVALDDEIIPFNSSCVHNLSFLVGSKTTHLYMLVQSIPLLLYHLGLCLSF